ncbi:ThiF family adenylyltransferase [Streptomyces sp. P38-E01]|uniref:ThiF family adenylyltransferase n=2 Tax=Streptomyces tardus TaxID=2780544 RepID=A0A949N704_9ACTN|nr:ThiF family adenylyltransferase [Streptomyces tardus]
MIKPALRRSWRNGQTVQYGVAPAHAVQLGPVDHTTGSFLELLDGTRSVVQLREAAQLMGLGGSLVDRLLDRLAGAGVLDDATAGRAIGRAAGSVLGSTAGSPACSALGSAVGSAAGSHTVTETGMRLGPDVASLSVVHPEPGGAARRVSTRRAGRVQVRGGGRVGSAVAALLAAGGIGQVEARDGGCVSPGDICPGGVGPEQTGERRAAALRRVVRRATPWSRPPQPRRGEQRGLDLVVITPRDGLEAYAPRPESARDLIEAGQPHLYAGVVEGTGFVGPLVVPGSSSCAECMMLDRTRREPAWPLIVGQWRSARGAAAAPACDGALASVVAGAAANAALRFLDGDDTDTVGTRVSYVLPHMWREEEELPAHAECPCGASAVTVGAREASPSVSRRTLPRIPGQQR